MVDIRGRPILLVEDNPDDVLITERAWKKGRIRHELHVVNDGEEAIHFLRKAGDHVDAPTPCLILLDLKLPRMDGFEVLEIVKNDDSLRDIPTVVLSSSNVNPSLELAYKLGCDGHIVKPVTSEKLIKTLIEIENTRETRARK